MHNAPHLKGAGSKKNFLMLYVAFVNPARGAFILPGKKVMGQRSQETETEIGCLARKTWFSIQGTLPSKLAPEVQKLKSATEVVLLPESAFVNCLRLFLKPFFKAPSQQRRLAFVHPDGSLENTA